MSEMYTVFYKINFMRTSRLEFGLKNMHNLKVGYANIPNKRFDQYNYFENMY